MEIFCILKSFRIVKRSRIRSVTFRYGKLRELNFNLSPVTLSDYKHLSNGTDKRTVQNSNTVCIFSYLWQNQFNQTIWIFVTVWSRQCETLGPKKRVSFKSVPVALELEANSSFYYKKIWIDPQITIFGCLTVQRIHHFNAKSALSYIKSLYDFFLWFLSNLAPNKMNRTRWFVALIIYKL